MTDYDVAVVGGGPSGSTTAYHLARAGVRVVVLDRARFPRDKPCGGGVTGRAFAQAPVDLTPVVEQEVSSVRLSFRLGDFFDHAYPRTLVYMTQRRRLDAFLLEHAKAAGAEVLDDRQVRDVNIDRRSTRVSTDGGEISARVLVGADGANGAVARSLGLAPAAEPPVALEANFHYAGAAPAAGEPPAGWRGVFALELGSIYGGYGWSFPKSDHFNVGCGGFRSEGAHLRGHLAQLAGHYGLDPALAANVRGHHLPTRIDGRPIARGDALLVGDAAGLVDPMSGEGIYAAFVSGRLAAGVIHKHLTTDTARQASRLALAYEAAVERELMPDLRAATLLRDAYHYMPRPCYAVVKRWPRLRESLCRLMLGEKTYAGFVHQAGPLRPFIALAAALGRSSRAGRHGDRGDAPR